MIKGQHILFINLDFIMILDKNIVKYQIVLFIIYNYFQLSSIVIIYMVKVHAMYLFHLLILNNNQFINILKIIKLINIQLLLQNILNLLLLLFLIFSIFIIFIYWLCLYWIYCWICYQSYWINNKYINKNNC